MLKEECKGLVVDGWGEAIQTIRAVAMRIANNILLFIFFMTILDF